MNEIPDFLKGIDPDMVRDMDQQMEKDAIHIAEEHMALIESYRQNYIDTLSEKETTIEMYLDDPCESSLEEMSEADEIARSHFVHYVDHIFKTSYLFNLQVRLAEAIALADGTQAPLNFLDTGRQFILTPTELRTMIAVILMEEDWAKAKAEVIALYDKHIRDVVLRFIDNM